MKFKFFWQQNLATFAMLCAGFSPVASAGPIAYVVSDSKQFGTIDLGTGAYTQRGATPDVLIGIGISGGTLYGVDVSDRLVAINPLNASAMVIGPTGITGSRPNPDLGAVSVFTSLTSGGLFAFDWSSNLYSINPATGVATFVGATGIPALSGPFGSIAAAGDAISLYYITEEISDPINQATIIPGSVYRVDPATGHAVLLTSALPTLPFLGAGFAGGSIYAFRAQLGPLPRPQIWQLDPANGSVQSILKSGSGRWSGIWRSRGACSGTGEPVSGIGSLFGQCFSAEATAMRRASSLAISGHRHRGRRWRLLNQHLHLILMQVKKMREAIYPFAGVVLLCFVCPTTAQAQPALTRKDLQLTGQFKSYFVRPYPVGFTTGDFNGDGRPDLVIGGLTFSVLLNTGQGTFAAPITTDFPSVNFCGPLVAADFNRDGKLDLFASNRCDFAGRLLLGRGDGTFLPREVPGCNHAAVGDFNGDGRPDLACNDPTSTSFRVLLGNGDGTFRSVVNLRLYAEQLAVADFNHDGKDDLILRSEVLSADGTIWILLGNGDGTFRTLSPIRGEAFVLGDFDADGVPDLATRSGILRGNGDGTFQALLRYASEPPVGGSDPIAAADLNGDGYLDLVVGGSTFDPVVNQVWIYYGKGDGSMLRPVAYTGWGADRGVIADFDGDGRPDLVTANLRSNTVFLLLSSGALPRAVSAASGTAVVAPGSVATLFASIPAAVTEKAADAAWPTRLGGLSLEMRDSSGVTRSVALASVSPEQVQFLVPEDATLGEGVLTILSEPVGSVQVEAVAPGIFLLQGWNMLPEALNLRIGLDGSRTLQSVYDCPSSCGHAPVPPSMAGVASYLVFSGTGFRNADPASLTCFLNGYSIPVDSIRPSATPGVDQITVRLPDESLDYWEGEITSNIGGSVILTANGVMVNTTWILFAKGDHWCESHTCGW